MGQVTATGYEPVALQDWVDTFEATYRTIYGSDIDLSAKAADGQLVGILAQMFADQDLQVATAYAMLDPNQASGAWVDQFLTYLGLSRKTPMTTLLTSVTISGTAGTIIRLPYYVTSTAGDSFSLNSPVQIGNSGTVSASFQSVNKGQFTVLAGDELTPTSVVVGVSKVVNNQVSSGGLSEELDADAIDRAFGSYGLGSTNTLDGVVAEIRNMSDVLACNGYENEDDATDANGLPPHSQLLVVDGGTPANIAQAIFNRKTPGTKQYQIDDSTAESYVITDVSNQPKTMKWNQPAYIEPYFVIVVARKELFTDISTDQIMATLRTLTYNIGVPASAFDMADALSGNNYYVQSFTLGRTDNDQTSILATAINERIMMANVPDENFNISVVNVS